MPIPKDKVKFTMWMRPEVKDKVNELYSKYGFISRSEFVEKAITFYSGYLLSEMQKEYLPDVILSTLQGTLKSFEDRMASLLFKLAVEQTMMMHIEAANFRVDDETLSRLRGLCVNEVKRLRGRVSFDEALKYQRGE